MIDDRKQVGDLQQLTNAVEATTAETTSTSATEVKSIKRTLNKNKQETFFYKKKKQIKKPNYFEIQGGWRQT